MRTDYCKELKLRMLQLDAQLPLTGTSQERAYTRNSHRVRVRPVRAANRVSTKQAAVELVSLNKCGTMRNSTARFVSYKYPPRYKITAQTPERNGRLARVTQTVGNMVRATLMQSIAHRSTT
jgi:hypothetical protein